MSKPINSRVLEGNFLVAGVRVVGGGGETQDRLCASTLRGPRCVTLLPHLESIGC